MTGLPALCCAVGGLLAALAGGHATPPSSPSGFPPAVHRAGDTASISFAAGAIQLTCDPTIWTVAEWPAGRQILLVLARSRDIPQTRQELTDGVWIAYTHAPEAPADEESLRRRLTRRLGWAVVKPFTSGATRTCMIDGRPAALQEFSATYPRGAAGDAERMQIEGFHLVAAMPAGWLDMHFVAPQQVAQRRRADAEQLWASLRLGAPQIAAAAVPPRLAEGLAEAAPVLGSWKSPGVLLSFAPDGEVLLRADRQTVYPLDTSGALRYGEPTTELTGTFTAHGDVLEITWQDGSRLRMRWRLDKGELFLTDHHGRVRQLGRIFR